MSTKPILVIMPPTITKPRLETKSKFILALEDYKEKYFMTTSNPADQYGTASQQPPAKPGEHSPTHTPPPPTKPHDPNKPSQPEHEDEHDKEEKK